MTPNTMATGRAVETNGIGKVTTAHLNLTVDMTGQTAFEVARKAAVSTQTRAKRESHSPKAPYAGARA